jgi:hypothetical protein
MEQRVVGTLQVWAEPFVPLRVPLLYNLRTAVVVDHGLRHPLVVVLVGRPVGLSVAQRRVAFGQLGQPSQREVELDDERLLHPQRPVVVEHRDACGRLDVVRAPLVGHRSDELLDGVPGLGVVPQVEADHDAGSRGLP